MIKAALIGIVAVLLAIPLKNQKSEYSIFISLGACILIFFIVSDRLESILEILTVVQSYIPSRSMEYLSVLLKILGITYIAELASSLCKDAGYGTISDQIALVGKLTVITMSIPVLMALLDTIQRFMA